MKQQQRPKGIWKVRANATSPGRDMAGSKRWFDDDSESSSLSGSSNSSKRQRLDIDDDDEQEIYYFYYRQPDSPALPSTKDRNQRRMPVSQKNIDDPCTLEDWEDLKDLFSRAQDVYEGDTQTQALTLLRGVIRECHRFLKAHQDPSVVYNPEPEPQTAPVPVKALELPTALHSIFGTALFLTGNIIAQDPSLILPGEPPTATLYWLAALDVLETGESLPSRTSGIGIDAPQDWRMAITWGRTLVCLADELLSRRVHQQGQATPQSQPISCFADPEPNWPTTSPFYIIARRRPPSTSRLTLRDSSANEIMILAMDQFSRGIFHMPHPQHIHSAPPPIIYASTTSSLAGPDSPINFFTTNPPLPASFSRAKELFTIASEVLLLSEKFDDVSERQHWASWADSVFSQMKMEADMEEWRGPITRARGRCWLIVGTARAEAVEDQLEGVGMDVENASSPLDVDGVLQTEEADDAREALEMAVGFLERAKGLTSDSSSPREPGEEDVPVGKLLAEALLTLANLTEDEPRREDMYRRAQKEGGEDFGLDVRMDEG